mmetsp:Transcript_158327/g.485099  ORF Transcript_158327/g.485099 Transcript_158327/m.485099 type:complete len:251 (-) Transcript_158327:3-755(-)
MVPLGPEPLEVERRRLAHGPGFPQPRARVAGGRQPRPRARLAPRLPRARRALPAAVGEDLPGQRPRRPLRGLHAEGPGGSPRARRGRRRAAPRGRGLCHLGRPHGALQLQPQTRLGQQAAAPHRGAGDHGAPAQRLAGGARGAPGGAVPRRDNYPLAQRVRAHGPAAGRDAHPGLGGHALLVPWPAQAQRGAARARGPGRGRARGLARRPLPEVPRRHLPRPHRAPAACVVRAGGALGPLPPVWSTPAVL